MGIREYFWLLHPPILPGHVSHLHPENPLPFSSELIYTTVFCCNRRHGPPPIQWIRPAQVLHRPRHSIRLFFWVSSLISTCPNGLGFFEHGGLSADRILRPIDPGIMMISADHPFVRKFFALDHRDHIITGNYFPVELQFQMHF